MSPIVRELLSLVGVALTAFVAYRAAHLTARSQQRQATAAERASKVAELDATLTGAIQLAAGVRTELDAVRRDLGEERRLSGELRARVESLEEENAHLRREVRELRSRVDRPSASRSRASDRPGPTVERLPPPPTGGAA